MINTSFLLSFRGGFGEVEHGDSSLSDLRYMYRFLSRRAIQPWPPASGRYSHQTHHSISFEGGERGTAPGLLPYPHHFLSMKAQKVEFEVM